MEPNEYLDRINQQGELVKYQESLQTTEVDNDDTNTSEYSGYDNDTLNFQHNRVSDDTGTTVHDFINSLKLTPMCKDQLKTIYRIAASNDNVYTYSSSRDLYRRADEFKLQVLELKNTLIGADADSLLFGDFDYAIEVLSSRLKTRNTRGLEGFETISSISSYSQVKSTEIQKSDNIQPAQTGTGLSRLKFFRKSEV